MRKGHFDGVIAVVDLLFQATKPDIAVFGEKDLQQVGVIRRLAQERHPDIDIHAGDLVRDENGLALSSRNSRLNEKGLGHARALSQTLFAMRQAHANGEDWATALEDARARLSAHPAVDLEYLDVVDEATFEPWEGTPNQRTYGIVAAQVQGVRLIDNARLMG
jgi:pantoate--beta-alanine ligase